MAGIDFNKFFGSSSTGGMNSINFSDYNQIRNGSYGKLLKSYYASQNSVNSTSKTSTSKVDTTKTNKTSKADSATKTYKKSTELNASTETTKMKSAADELKTSAESLANNDAWKKKNGTLDKDALLKSVKEVASDYNDVIAQNDKVATKSVTNQTQYMKNASSTMSKALEKVGVTFDKDGKMSVNEDTFKKAEEKDLRAAFYGSYSYSSQISSNAAAIGSAAARTTATYGGDGNLSNYMNYSYNQWT